MSEVLTEKHISPPPLTALTEDEVLFRDNIRQFAEEAIRPHVREMDEKAVFERSIIASLADTKNAFATAASLFDTKTGEVEGSGPIQGAGGLGEINAKSYGVYDKGDRMVFKGGVHTRLNVK